MTNDCAAHPSPRRSPHDRTRRRLVLGAAAAPLLVPFSARAAWPERTIEWVVPYPAGGGTDVVARVLAEQMGKSLGQTIVVNNKPGAGTNIGADYVAKAKPDGYTLLSADTATLAANPFLYSKLPYNAETDFAPIGLMARFPLILVVNPSLGVRDLTGFLAWAKAQPQPIPYASPGAGSPHHLTMELFRGRTGLKLTHVPYRGAAPAVQDVIGGQVPMMFVDTAAGYAHINSGKLIPLGIASGQRVANFERIPTLQAQGIGGFEAYAWQGLVAPAGTAQPVIAQIGQALRAAIDSTPVRARFQVLGLEAIPSGPQEMAAYAKAERAKWSGVIRSAGIRLD